ncbi:predicted protein [Sclerotinia sclerotiorum 1980 UF-70]|uniref:Uncharacterized protein n=1 Tax=Sclerotinia sclerotiorum (strain ATCC 18683 / 1980 / Ss-1) TaxID=665079 RepID=A7ED07_SCLS1|nr:predicted protein [Sclerotinia sclerotiorum 1980 UF-70]EDO00723.1 predicted protein [Sclerotinia sclerotiorum 1980 UF-70]
MVCRLYSGPSLVAKRSTGHQESRKVDTLDDDKAESESNAFSCR